MTDRSVTNSVTNATFTIERRYPAHPAKVFGAWADGDAKTIWMDDEDYASDGTDYELDFRVGGHERFGGQDPAGVSYRYDAVYYDIVPDHRIVYSYEMYRGETRISVSLATIEFAERDGLTRLTVSEYGAYLDGFDGPDANGLRREGVAAMLDQLTGYLAAQPNG